MKLLELKNKAKAKEAERLEERRRMREIKKAKRAQGMEIVDDLVMECVAFVTSVDREDLEQFLTVHAHDGDWIWDGSLVMNDVVLPMEVVARIKVSGHMVVEATLKATPVDSLPTSKVAYSLEGASWWTRNKKYESLGEALCEAEIKYPLEIVESER